MDFENDNHSFTFRFHSAEGERDLEMNCNALYLGDILDRFRDFLQGCGYQIDGMIDVVPFEKEDNYITLDDEPVVLSDEPKFDFSNVPNNNWPFGGTMNDTIPAQATQQFQNWSAELPSSTGSKIKVNF